MLDTYVFSDSDREAVKKAASLHSGVDENLAWLHLYFDEVIWPASERQKADVSKFAAAAVQTPGGEGSGRNKYFMRIDGLDPKEKEAWVPASVNTAVAFARSSAADRNKAPQLRDDKESVENNAKAPFILAVTGISASGKSTIAQELAAALGGARVVAGDDFFLFDQFLTDDCPMRQGTSGTRE